ncbi:MAG: hypothetical protein AAFZ18_23260 [Myxococcota bacterium]
MNDWRRTWCAVIVTGALSSACSDPWKSLTNTSRAPARAALDTDAGSYQIQSGAHEADAAGGYRVELGRCSAPFAQGSGRVPLLEAPPALLDAVIQGEQERAAKTYEARVTPEGHRMFDAGRGSLTATVTSKGSAFLTARNHGLELEVRTIGVTGWALSASSTIARYNRAGFARTGFDESYIHGPLGIGHEFRIQAPRRIPSSLRIDLEVEGRAPHMAVAPGKTGVRFGGTEGAALINDYLVAYDADGRGLKSTFQVTASTVALVVSAKKARWPLRVRTLWKLEAEADVVGSHTWSRVLGDPVVLHKDVAIIRRAPNPDPGGDSDRVEIYRRRRDEWALEHEERHPARKLGRRVAVQGDRVLLSREDPHDVVLIERGESGWQAGGIFAVTTCPLDLEIDGSTVAVLQAHQVSTWEERNGRWDRAAELHFRHETSSFPKNIEDADHMSLSGGWMALSLRHLRTWQEVRRACDFSGCANRMAYPRQFTYLLRLYPISELGELGPAVERSVGLSARYYRWRGSEFTPEDAHEGWGRPRGLEATRDEVTFSAVDPLSSEPNRLRSYVMSRTESGWAWPEVREDSDGQEGPIEVAAGGRERE